MDWSVVVIPLTVAGVGVVAVAAGAWVAARSALRVRLIDMMREEARDHRSFQIRAVAAVNELGTASAHLIRARLTFMREKRDEAHARSIAAGGGAPIVLEGPFDISPSQDARVAAATDEWRSILAEGHAFASGGTGAALEAFDLKRAELVIAVNDGTAQADISDAVRGLEAAARVCDDLRAHYARQIYRQLQVEKAAGAARVFQLAHIRLLRTFAKKLTARYYSDIGAAEAVIAEAAADREGAGPQRG